MASTKKELLLKSRKFKKIADKLLIDTNFYV